ncbi:MAG: hypothetical protein IPM13_00980 [Phycisphaerales bacterium]|nr:hypothetical protein [Phycisphaerales bacterium]
MAIEAKAAAILRDAEASLRQLAAEAASAGDYAGIIKVAAWAKTISDLVKATPAADEAKPVSQPQKASLDKKVQSRRMATRATERREYPRFFRNRDQLVRVAWSKREKKEYQHKASRSALLSLVSALVEAGKDGRVFTTDQVLPIRDSTDGSEIPNYQSYVCIAWLKQTGLIDQHGRQGYSVPRLAELRDAVEAIWRSLPTK